MAATRIIHIVSALSSKQRKPIQAHKTLCHSSSCRGEEQEDSSVDTRLLEAAGDRQAATVTTTTTTTTAVV
jgi:hypothetical protein